jgi:hypothetical protein
LFDPNLLVGQRFRQAEPGWVAVGLRGLVRRSAHRANYSRILNTYSRRHP